MPTGIKSRHRGPPESVAIKDNWPAILSVMTGEGAHKCEKAYESVLKEPYFAFYDWVSLLGIGYM